MQVNLRTVSECAWGDWLWTVFGYEYIVVINNSDDGLFRVMAREEPIMAVLVETLTEALGKGGHRPWRWKGQHMPAVPDGRAEQRHDPRAGASS